MVVSATRNAVTVWDAPKGVIVARLDGHKTRVTSVSLSPDSESLVSGSLDGTVRVWEVKTGRQLKNIGEEHDLVIDVPCPQKVIWSEDGRSVAVAYDRSRVMILSTDTWLTVAWCGQAANASTVHFANEGTGIVFAAESPRSQIVKWDITSNRTDHFSASSAHEDIWYMSLSRNGTRLATAGKEGKIAIWNLDAVHWIKSSR